jgi:hypothetical protein
MKKFLCLGVLLFVPAITHAQTHAPAGSAPSNSNSGGAGGGAGGSISGGGNSVTPAIDRHHNATSGVTAFKNPGVFEPTEVLPWAQAVNLGEPKPEKSLAAVARESREEKARDNNPARVTFTN